MDDRKNAECFAVFSTNYELVLFTISPLLQI